ncbi:MAG TPA: glycoside hydrolase family 3 N-terminal domain-containing protein [Pseudomonas sp.]|nr:glycoside hydrolase family 3 N-terminal domain-containing protein [Pseudomonas sp.]
MLFALLRWLLALGLLALAWYGRDPHLLGMRPFIVPLLGLVSGLGLFWVFRRPSRLARKAWAALLVVGLGMGLAQEALFQWHKAVVLGSGGSKEAQRLGRHFVLGYTDLDEVLPLVAGGLIGGIFITRRNVEGKTARQIGEEIGALQALRKAAGLPPLIVSTDQEGGIVSRLSPPLPLQPALAGLVLDSRSPEAQAAIARAYGAEQGGALAALGITLNFSPVLDLKVERAKNPLDLHSLIHLRALSADPDTVTRVAQAYAEGLQAQGVRPTLKHFPGLGRIASDTHHFSAVLDTPIEQLSAHDWRPFRQLMAQTRAWVMLGHVILPELDSRYPVSLSRPVVQQVLRQEFAYQGVLISDDLTMAAAQRFGACQTGAQALNAGVDLLLIAYDPDQYYSALHCALRAQADGELDSVLLEQSDRRLAASVL